jgi:hypothetical protein
LCSGYSVSLNMSTTLSSSFSVRGQKQTS